MSLENNKLAKTVLITGAAKGIGKEIALEFKKNGYNTIVTYNTSLKYIKELEDLGIVCYKMDVTKIDSIKTVILDIVKNYGKIDTLINNSGISSYSLFTDITDNDFNNMLDVNLLGASRVIREVLKQTMLHEKNGSIINISSVWGITGASLESHYSSSKAGLIGLSKSLAKELGLSNITVNVIAPGVINTDMINTLTDEDIEVLKNNIPLNRIGTGKDIAPMAVFLASEGARYITGQVITIDGGMIG